MKEIQFLKGWHLKLAIISAIVIPTATATGHYYEIQNKIDTRISEIQLQSEKRFADKDSLKEIQQDIKEMHADIVEIKTILKHHR